MITLTGLGYDIHRFSETPRPLILGGVEVHPEHGLDGHSDADVLCHALADAILGALGEPDIGFWFPPGEASCKNICSLRIVEKAVSLLHEQGGRLNNVDCALIAEAPKIMPFTQQMKATLAPILGLSAKRVGIKATTNEKLGALGRREGMAAFATVSLQMPEEDEASELVRLLKRNAQTITVAESCTGGLIAAALTSVAGASEVLRRSWVCYSAEAKQEDLGVPAELIEHEGIVSEAVAEAMAEGALERAQADYALAITGNAGPTAEQGNAPVGQICIALATEQCTSSLTQHFPATFNRQQIRELATLAALSLALTSIPPTS